MDKSVRPMLKFMPILVIIICITFAFGFFYWDTNKLPDDDVGVPDDDVGVPPVLWSITPNPDSDGDICIIWYTVENASLYEIYRNMDGGKYILIGNREDTLLINMLSYGDKDLFDGEYGYKIRAIYRTGESGFSNIEFVTVNIYVKSSGEINSLDFTLGYQLKPLSNSYIDDDNWVYFIRDIEGGTNIIDVEFVFDPDVGGRDFYISCHLVVESSDYRALRINGKDWKTTTIMDFDDELVEGVNSISFYATPDGILTGALYYFKIVEKM